MKNRDHPSTRYGELIGLYTKLHKEGEHYLGLAPDSTYPGISLLPHIHRIKALIGETGARTILDYGSGKGSSTMRSPVAGLRCTSIRASCRLNCGWAGFSPRWDSEIKRSKRAVSHSM